MDTAFTALRTRFLDNSTLSHCHSKDPLTNKTLFLTWSEANIPAYRCACDTVLAPSNTTTADYHGVLLGMRNAVNFDYADFNFAWIGYMSTNSTSTTNWGGAYLDDFDWIMSRQSEFGLNDWNRRSTLQMTGAWPGFDDINVPASWNNGQSRYLARNVTSGLTANLSYASAAKYANSHLSMSATLNNFDIPWLVWNTWNDFPEGTMIEPCATSPNVDGFGYGYTSLEAAQTNSAAFKVVTSPFQPSSLRLPALLLAC